MVYIGHLSGKHRLTPNLLDRVAGNERLWWGFAHHFRPTKGTRVDLSAHNRLEGETCGIPHLAKKPAKSGKTGFLADPYFVLSIYPSVSLSITLRR